MGAFDSVWFKRKDGEECDIQFKSGECCQINYEIGDKIANIPDGVHVEFDGLFVVYKGVIVAAFHKDDNPIWNKWGGQMSFPKIGDSPIVKIAKAMKENKETEENDNA